MIVMDFLHKDAFDGTTEYVGYANSAAMVALKGEPYRSGIPHDDFGDFFRARKLDMIGSIISPQKLARRYLPGRHEEPIVPFYSYVLLGPT